MLALMRFLRRLMLLEAVGLAVPDACVACPAAASVADETSGLLDEFWAAAALLPLSFSGFALTKVWGDAVADADAKLWLPFWLLVLDEFFEAMFILTTSVEDAAAFFFSSSRCAAARLFLVVPLDSSMTAEADGSEAAGAFACLIYSALFA